MTARSPTPTGSNELLAPLIVHLLSMVSELKKDVGTLIGETSSLKDEVFARFSRNEEEMDKHAERVLAIEKERLRNRTGQGLKLSLSSVVAVLKVAAHIPWGKVILTLQALVAGGYMITSPGGAKVLLRALLQWGVDFLGRAGGS